MVLLNSQCQFYLDPLTLAISSRFPIFGQVCTLSPPRSLNSGRRAGIGNQRQCASSFLLPHFELHTNYYFRSQMLDIGTLDSQKDRQILLKLVALLTSLIAAQYRDRLPSSTPCRSGPACSYGTRCWFSHAAPHTVRRSGTPPPATASSKRIAASWRTSGRPSAAREQLASSPLPARPSSTAPPSGGNTFGPLAPQRRRRRDPHVPRSTAGCSSG